MHTKFKVILFIFYLLQFSSIRAGGFSFDHFPEDTTETKSIIEERNLSISMGWFFSEYSSELQANSKTLGIGTNIRLENVFLLPETNRIFRANAEYRISGNHYIGLNYYSMKRSAKTLVDRKIKFGDLLINIGSETDAFWNLKLYGLQYHYSHIREATFEAGFTAGINILDLNVGVTARLNNAVGQKFYDKMIYIPVLGVYNRHLFWNSFILKYSIDFFMLKAGKIDGVLTDINIAFEYYLIKQLGIGIGYSSFLIDLVLISSDDFDGKIEYSHRGVLLFVTFSL